nr:immunoglobulin light chain junction region [Macaca mulatta]
CLQGYRTPFIF